jgi:selenium metabolism protein YedF
MNKTIDACGLTCPGPVLLVKDAVEQTKGQQITVLVDNPASLENVCRFLGSRGYSVTNSQEGELFRITAQNELKTPDADITPSAAIEKAEGNTLEAAGKKILVIVTSDCLGSGDDALGTKLMISYLKTVKEMGTDLWQVIFINGGVKLTTASSPVLEELQGYERSGVIIFACGTCLEHFGLTALKKVGGSTNMLDIVTASQLADKVITFG